MSTKLRSYCIVYAIMQLAFLLNRIRYEYLYMYRKIDLHNFWLRIIDCVDMNENDCKYTELKSYKLGGQ